MAADEYTGVSTSISAAQRARHAVRQHFQAVWYHAGELRAASLKVRGKSRDFAEPRRDVRLPLREVTWWRCIKKGKIDPVIGRDGEIRRDTHTVAPHQEQPGAYLHWRVKTAERKALRATLAGDARGPQAHDDICAGMGALIAGAIPRRV